jgi:preprotein translocase subunit SecG
MSNLALTTWILLVFLFAAGLALGSLARAGFERQKRTPAARHKGGVDKPDEQS